MPNLLTILLKIFSLIGRPFYLALIYITALTSSLLLAFLLTLKSIHSYLQKLSLKYIQKLARLKKRPAPIFKKLDLKLFSLLKFKVTKFCLNIGFRLKHKPKTVFPRHFHQLKIILPLSTSFKKIFSKKFLFIFPLLFLFLGFSVFLYFYIFYQLPSPQELTTRKQKLTTTITDRHGQVLFKIYQDENRTPIKLKDLSENTKNAFIAIEDKDFYNHQGFSLRGIVRAVTRNLTQDDNQGGSTITQQLIKNALLDPRQTFQRKIKELVLAVQTEIFFDKDTILEMYLNEVGFGGPAYGIQEAAEQYFNLNAQDLNLAQSAFLAGLPKAPSKFSPYLSPQTALSRQKLVLLKMWQQGFISQSQLDQALNTQLEFSPPQIEIKAPHFVMYVRDLLVDQYGEALVTHGGLQVTTSLDLDIQEMAQKVVNSEVDRLRPLSVHNGSALISVPQTGEILAMIGSRDYFDIENDGQVNLTTSLRQPGSSIKPINYALAFEKGSTPADFIQDTPIVYKIGDEIWIPKNYDNKFHGTVSLRQALANSYNVPAVKLLEKNGVANMIKLAQDLGITSWNDPNRYGLAITLGSLEVKLTEMAQVYATFANSGLNVPLNPVLKVTDQNGQSLPFSPCYQKDLPPTSSFLIPTRGIDCSPKNVLSPETAFLISDILSDNSARAAAFGFNSILNIKDHQVAVKTGTSNDLRDNWTIGYTPDILVATWVGNNDNTPMSRIASGITGASPIWSRIITLLLKQNANNSTFIPPPNLVHLSICSLTGSLNCNGCPSRMEYFVKGSQPQKSCIPAQVQNLKTDMSLEGKTAP